jgi:hypothetical protein
MSQYGGTSDLAITTPHSQGYINGLILTYVDTTHIDFGVGVCRNSTNIVNIDNLATYRKALAATWAAGSNANGLDTGGVGNNKWYHVFIIRKDADGTDDFLFSLSPTAPTMPAGYTYFCRIGAVRTDGSAHILSFTQYGDEFRWIVQHDEYSATPDNTAQTVTLAYVPTGVKVWWIPSYVGFSNSAVPAYLNVSAMDDTDEAGGVAISVTAQVASMVNYLQLAPIRTNTSAQVRFRSNKATNNVESAGSRGWIDPRGRTD